MIPKIIHYCWFGGEEKPQEVLDCIYSWKKNLPDYEIKEWNEYNFNYNICDFTKEAYKLKKYAFVSDVARLFVLDKEGGIYLDTDVKLLKSFDSFLNNRSFIGRESPCILSTAVIGAHPGMIWIKDVLNGYICKGKHFIKKDGTLDTEPNTIKISSFITWTWANRKNELRIYDEDYFCCKSLQTKEVTVTENSVAIHNFNGSWCSKNQELTLATRMKNIWIKAKLRFVE